MSEHVTLNITNDKLIVHTSHDNRTFMCNDYMQVIRYLERILTKEELLCLEKSIYNACKLKGMNIDDLY